MRMMVVVAVGLTLMAIITVCWYISNALFVSIAGALTVTEGSAVGTMNLIGYANILWGPALDLLVLFWMVASSQARDVESEYYG